MTADDLPSPSAGLEERVALLERRFATLEDEQAIERLQYMFGFYLDGHMWDAVVQLFADDAPSIEFGQRGRYEGKERILRFLHDVLGGGRDGLRRDEIDNWIQMQWIVTVDGDKAQARGRALRMSFDGKDHTAIGWEEGLYENRYTRQGGTWRIESLWYVPNLAVRMPTIGNTWHESLPESAMFAADRPSLPIDPALGRSFQPYHYDHPITGEPVPAPSIAAG